MCVGYREGCVCVRVCVSDMEEAVSGNEKWK